MANSFDSNFTRKIARTFLAGFNSKRVMSKNVNTQLLQGKFDPASGANVDFKRPTDYVTVRTAAGDLTSDTASDIITGKATGTVQNYFTAFVDYSEADEAIKMDQIDQLLDPLSTRVCTDFELDFAKFMMANSALLANTYGTAADAWADVANAGALMQATGVPMDRPWYYAINPFTQAALSETQRSLGAGGSAGGAVMSALQKATIVQGFAGFDRVMTATTLPTVTPVGADRAGALTAVPTLTYAGAKDSMTQTIAVDGFTADLAIAAGEVLTIAGRYRNNLSTRETVVNAAGSKILWSATVQTAVTLSGTGTGSIVVTGPGIYESAGAYNTVDSAFEDNDVVTLLGTAGTTYQPNLFWHKDAFGVGSVPIKRLHSTDTFAQTKDGLQFRVSKGSDWTKNTQQVRIDFRPAYACLNPFFAGQGFGS